MEQKLQNFFQSGLLEKYVLGETTPSENLQVEHFIETYLEVEKEYLRLQDNLEIISKFNAVKAPTRVLDDILDEVTVTDTPVLHIREHSRRTPWYSIAASILVLIFAGSTFLMYQQNKLLVEENQVVVDEIFDLRSDIDQNNRILDNLMRQFTKLNNPETEKYVLRGNERAKNLKTVAYINAVDKTSMIDVASLPQLPKNHTYQIWAQLQDDMVNLGILDPSEREFQSIPYLEDALGLSISIESNADMADTSDNAVAEISLNNKDN
ncbi:anti-sigma factor [Psychroserpens sp.]|uniref:anti-sigma factor n=1 Tax=Psychroserpens sp. TaxID=2020870 RepID=UPI001B1FAF21|nr:anti-sigma factor [Psychroserpens sp.]MBO6605959.1 anti-sigma factor [Psychroserpens sp.]MBO6632443.1 anti-sigma factor [Psychroserpens sp.]MBO6652670.1 anti-sigma factor [Psychroserpens sp.]MBO6681558.1 anti-sigma factor [Psychroserpens sp.]MBO6749333.1 anti-sigma factor [Psychroserpens sp.]